MAKSDFKIKVKANIGSGSKGVFGDVGTIIKVENGMVIDLEEFDWDIGSCGDADIDDVNEYFGYSDELQTVFEIVED